MVDSNREMNELRWQSRSTDDTDRLASALATALPTTAVIALVGNLGAGKTRFVQGLAAALGVARDEVVSPTFVLCQEYHGTRTIQHYDLYRLHREQEFWNLGPDEAFESPGVVLIEWADRFPQCLPANHLEIRIEPIDENSREFIVRAKGQGYEATLGALRESLT